MFTSVSHLGGQLSMAEVRAKQFSDHRHSSVKKKVSAKLIHWNVVNQNEL